MSTRGSSVAELSALGPLGRNLTTSMTSYTSHRQIKCFPSVTKIFWRVKHFLVQCDMAHCMGGGTWHDNWLGEAVEVGGPIGTMRAIRGGRIRTNWGREEAGRTIPVPGDACEPREKFNEYKKLDECRDWHGHCSTYRVGNSAVGPGGVSRARAGGGLSGTLGSRRDRTTIRNSKKE